MFNFKNDYNCLCHENILEALMKYQNDTFEVYGKDIRSENAKNLIKKYLKNDNVDIHFLVGGTIVNKTVISHILRPYEAVISATTGHINVHETGAIGNKILLVENVNGKISVEGIDKVYQEHTDEHMVKPRLVYISNSTEYGTIYSLKELQEISSYCKAHNLLFFVDGARLGAALTSKFNDVTLKDLGELTDAFYIGGTKNGAILGEALVINNQSLQENFRYSIKHYGGMYSKGFVAGIQFETLFEDNLFFDIAKKENLLAERLLEGLKKLNLPLYLKVETNQVFVILSTKQYEAIKEQISCEVFGQINHDIIVRFVTHYMLNDEDIDQALNIIASSL